MCLLENRFERQNLRPLRSIGAAAGVQESSKRAADLILPINLLIKYIDTDSPQTRQCQ